MFGRRNLQKDGVHAEAVVRNGELTGSINSHGAHRWKLDLR